MYIVGASTLGRMALDVARGMGLAVRGFVDDEVSTAPAWCDLPLEGGVPWLVARARAGGGIAAFVAIGDNDKRAGLFRTLRASGVIFPNLVDPRACVAASAALGAGNLVMAHAYVGTGVTIGDANVLLPGVCLTHDNEVGDANFFAPGVSVGGRTRIPSLCKFGMNCVVKPDLSLADAFSCGPATVVDKP